MPCLMMPLLATITCLGLLVRDNSKMVVEVVLLECYVVTLALLW